MEYVDYKIKNCQLKSNFNNYNLKKPMTNVELEKYYREQYYRYPYNCFPKQIAFEKYQHYMKLNIEENLNGITRCSRY